MVSQNEHYFIHREWGEWWPQKVCPRPEHVNRALSGKRVFGDVVKDLKLRSSRVRVTFNPIKRVLISNKRGHRGEAS